MYRLLEAAIYCPAKQEGKHKILNVVNDDGDYFRAGGDIDARHGREEKYQPHPGNDKKPSESGHHTLTIRG
jgi:hypothetical protein